MLIYAFLEHYPSPYKPYFDSQFEQFLRDGHALRNFSFGLAPGPPSEKVRKHGLDRLTSYLPTLLGQMPGFLPAMLRNFLKDPVGVFRNCWRAARNSSGLKHIFLSVMRASLLPAKAPDICLVHNLITQRNTRFLRYVYPGVPVAFYYHGGELPGVPTVSDAEAIAAFGAADVVFTNTSSSRQQAIDRGCDQGKVVISPMGFNLDDFVPLADRPFRRDGNLNLLIVSRLSEEKGLMLAVEAMRQLRGQGITDVRMRIIGGGPLAETLKAKIIEQGLGEWVELLGVKSLEQCNAELARADALLLPSIPFGTWKETQACVVQEAMLMRALVATSTAGGVPESTAPELRRFSYQPGNTEALAQAILDLRSLDVAQMARLADDGRRFAVENYDIAKLNQRLLAATLARSPKGQACGA
jgi:glycosyltransferase involved in cell wall biosynthesis